MRRSRLRAGAAGRHGDPRRSSPRRAATTTTATPVPPPRRRGGATTTAASGELKPVKLQLQWVTRPSSPATSPPSTRASTRSTGSTSSCSRAASTSSPQTVLAQGNADFAIAWVPKALPVARAGRGHHRHRPDLPAVGHAPGVVQGRRHHRPGRPQGQEGRQLGLRQRVRAVRGHDRGRPRPGQGRHAGAAGLQHAGPAQRRHRRRPGHDLQRVRPGARGRRTPPPASSTSPTSSTSSTGTRSARPCSRTPSGPTPTGSSDADYQATAVSLLKALDRGLGVLPGQPRGVPRHRRGARARSSATATSCGR